MALNSIKIYYKGYKDNIREAINKANQLLRDKEFYNRIRQHPRFDMANVTPAQVADLMQIADINMTVDFYYSLSPMNNAYGYDNTENPAIIYLNAWQINRPVASICNSLIHACVHAVNAQHPSLSFSHGYDFTKKNDNTAPYWIGCLAQQMVSGDNTIYEYMRHETARQQLPA